MGISVYIYIYAYLEPNGRPLFLWRWPELLLWGLIWVLGTEVFWSEYGESKLDYTVEITPFLNTAEGAMEPPGT